MWTFTPTESRKLVARLGILGEALADGAQFTARPAATSTAGSKRRTVIASSLPELSDALVRLFGGELLERLGGGAPPKLPGRHRARDDRARGHHAVVADAHARQHNRSAADPDVAPDVHRCDGHAPARLDLVEVRVVYRGQVPDEGVVADRHALRRVNCHAAVDEHTVPDLEHAARP